MDRNFQEELKQIFAYGKTSTLKNLDLDFSQKRFMIVKGPLDRPIEIGLTMQEALSAIMTRYYSDTYRIMEA